MSLTNFWRISTPEEPERTPGKRWQKFGRTAEEGENKYKNSRTSYTCYLKKVESVPSVSGRDTSPKTEHINHRKSGQIMRVTRKKLCNSKMTKWTTSSNGEKDTTNLPVSSESRPTSNQSSTRTNEVAVVINPKKNNSICIEDNEASMGSSELVIRKHKRCWSGNDSSYRKTLARAITKDSICWWRWWRNAFCKEFSKKTNLALALTLKNSQKEQRRFCGFNLNR